MKRIFILIILLFSILLSFCSDYSNNPESDPEIIDVYEYESFISGIKLYDGVFNKEDNLVSFQVPIYDYYEFNYFINPKILIFNNKGGIINSVPIDEARNFDTYSHVDHIIDSVLYFNPIGLRVDFAQNSLDEIFVSSNMSKFIYKIEDGTLTEFCNLGYGIQSIACDTLDNIFAIKAPIFESDSYQLIQPPVIFEVSPLGKKQKYFSFPFDYIYQFGTGGFIDLNEDNTRFLHPNPMSLYFDQNMDLLVSIMVLDKIFKINTIKELEIFAEIAAPADLAIDSSGDVFILQAPYKSFSGGTEKWDFPLKLINFTKDIVLYENFDFEWSNSYLGNSRGDYLSGQSNFSLLPTKYDNGYYIISPLNNEVIKLSKK